MTETKQNRVSLKISRSLWSDIEDEKDRQRRILGRRPTTEEVIAKRLQDQTKGITRETLAEARDTIPTREPEIHGKLDYILEHSAPEVANFIRGNIEVFARDTRREQAHAADSDQVPAASDTGRNKRPDPDAPTPRRTRTPTKRKGDPTPISTSGRRRR